jgi:Na+/alanine symporter
MAIPNLIGVFLLSGTVVRLVKNYFSEDEYESYWDQQNK